jgi:YidC/Oxa1 family membrane protein insertase
MMENRRLILFVGLGFALILLWMQGVAWMDKHHPGWAGQPPATQPAVNSSSQPTPPPPAPASQQVAGTQASTTAPGIGAGDNGPARVIAATQNAAPPEPVSLGSDKLKDPDFTLDLKLDPRGAGVRSVVLNQFKSAAETNEPYTFEQPPKRHEDLIPFASRSITVDKVTYDLGSLQWAVVSRSPTQAVYGADLIRDGKSVLEIRKRYAITKAADPDTRGYEIQLEYSLNNLTDQPLTIQTDFNGPVLPPGESNRSPDRQVLGGYLDNTSVLLEPHPVEEFKTDKVDIDITHDSKSRQHRWVGAASNYFGSIVLPQNMINAGKDTDPNYFNSVVAHGLNLDSEHTTDHDVYLTIQTKEIKLDPHQSAVLPMSVYFGPKWREVLQTPHYATFPRQYNILLVISGGICGFCTFAWLVNGIILLLGVMYKVFHDWGLAIIGLVAIVRILLHPITKRSQISMSKMSKMGPEMKRLQEKYKDDKDALNKAMMQFHKEQGLGPYLGCLPMFLQMPIWIALYGVLQTTFELRQAPFLYGWTWIKDLSQPDYILRFSTPIRLPLLGALMGDIHGISLLPFLLATAMFLQQQFMPKPVAATPEQIQQQKMMQWMSPIMFLLIFYTYPSGLNLYIATSTIVGIIESKIVRDHIKAREEAEKAGRVFVSTKPSRASRMGRTDAATNAANSNGEGLMGRIMRAWNKVLEHAEQAKKENDRRKKDE